MRVILDIDKPVLEKLDEFAKKEKRSRKNLMEIILESVTQEVEQTTFQKSTEQKKEEPKEELTGWRKKLFEQQQKLKK